MKRHIIILTLAFLVSVNYGCKKYLDEKPDAKLAVPTTLVDFQALLDRYPVMNGEDPSSGEISADNYFLADTNYLALSQQTDRNMYTWQKGNLFLPQSNDWYSCYRPVFTANTVLEGLNNINETSGNQSDYNNVKGQALYARGKAFLLVTGLWAPAYNESSANTQPGIPLRLSSDFNQPSVRSSVQATYAQIIADLASAAKLLPVTSIQAMRPSKPAAFAMLARAYLFMRQYEKAGLYADSCLQLYSKLLDYNTLNPASNGPVPQFNTEVIQESMIPAPEILYNIAEIDSQLYKSYAVNDLRKTIFFKSSNNGTYIFKGSYEGNANLFSGVATDEVYLMRAECFARAGNTNAALKDLNTLLINRFQAGSFVPYSASGGDVALSLVLAERRKELLMRGLRWADLKRLNMDGANIILTRNLSGQVYTLLPNSPRYVLPIPDDIIQLTGMQQNIR